MLASKIHGKFTAPYMKISKPQFKYNTSKSIITP